MLAIKTYHVQRSHPTGKIFDYSDSIYDTNANTTINRNDAIKWLSLVSSWGGICKFTQLPNVSRTVALEFVQEHIQNHASSFKVVEIFKQLLDQDSKNLMQHAFSNNQPIPTNTRPLIGAVPIENLTKLPNSNVYVHNDDVDAILTYTQQLPMNEVIISERVNKTIAFNPQTIEEFIIMYHKYLAQNIILSRHTYILNYIKDYLLGLSPQSTNEPHITLEECIIQLFIKYDWTCDQTVVNIINDLANCKCEDDFTERYLNNYILEDLRQVEMCLQLGSLPQNKDAEIANIVDQTCYRVLQLMAFAPQTQTWNPISLLEVISCHLLYLIKRIFTQSGVASDDAATAATCFHAIGMVFVDAITDRVTHEIQNSSKNAFMLALIDKYKKYLRSHNMKVPNTIDTIGQTQATLDKHIQDFLQHEKDVDLSYFTFLKTYFLNRMARSEYKVVEFLVQMAKMNTETVRSNAKETHREIICVTENNLKRLIEKYPTALQGNGIMYDQEFITNTLLTRRFGEYIKEYNATLYSMLMTMTTENAPTSQ